MIKLFKMWKNKINLYVELFVLFVAIPAFLIVTVLVVIKVGLVLMGVIYALVVVLKNKLVKTRSLYLFPGKTYLKYIVLRFAILIVFTIIWMHFFHQEKLFIVVRKNIKMWVAISLFYSVFSVYPQEFLYRTFFFKRYGKLFQHPFWLIAVNTIVFSFAHIGFKNPFVLTITFIGGIIFAITYYRTSSLLLTSVEHAIYGSWLFTVGMGEMLAFPLPS